MFLRISTDKSMKNFSDKINRVKDLLKNADAVIIGAGAGLSTSAGFEYSGERFEKYFSDFAEKYGITDMYSGGFYPYQTLEEYWAWWSRQIYCNRYIDAPKPLYQKLLSLVKDKDCFVITTNVDHCFQKSGFDKQRLFYMQGDYGLFQCCKPCCQKTYDNEELVLKMVQLQKNMKIPSELVPYCPNCGQPMTTNLRCDDSFVQDEGWYKAKNRYDDFIRRHEGLKTVFLELGVGNNTPIWIKYPFQKMTAQNPNASYVCVNLGCAYAPPEIKDQSVCIDSDILTVIDKLL